MKKSRTKKSVFNESVTCGICNTIVASPENENSRNTCGCINQAWIMKLPTNNCWAYGAYDFNRVTRNKNENK